MQTPQAGATKRFDSAFYVEGYAATYDEYRLFTLNEDTEVFERFERHCFDTADMSDIIMQYDHAGRVFARTSNHSLLVEPDDHGLFTAADLSLSQGAKDLYGDISARLITRMSWAFMPGEYELEESDKKIVIVHKSIKKIYDVSAVSLPANDGTTIYSRMLDDGEIGRAVQELRALDRARKKQQLIINTLTGGF